MLESFEPKDPGDSSSSIPLDRKSDKPELRMDDGLVAWVQCASSFCLSMGTWGVGNSYGKHVT